MIQRAEAVYAPAGQIRYFDLALTKGEGALLTDADGNQYIDLLASASATNVGHSHPTVVKAMEEQMREMIHYTPAYFYHEKLVELSERLVESTPGDFQKRVLFGNSGSDANEAIMKFSRAYTGRQNIITFQGAYHGSTYGAMTLSAVSLNMRRKMQTLVPNVYYIPFPNTFDRLEGETDAELSKRHWKVFEHVMETYLPVDEIACVLIEAIQGDGGFLKMPQEYMDRLYTFCQDNGVVFAVDEINQGMGRTGKMWSMEHFGLAPDLMSVGKSFASGMPLSAVVGRKEILESLEAPAHTFTTSGNPVCCAASLATFDILEDEKLVGKSAEDGEYVRKRFEEMKEKYDCIGDVRIYGLNGGIEIVESQASKVRDGEAASKVITYLKDHGVLMITVAGNVLRFQPPLVITREQLDTALDIIEEAFEALVNGKIELAFDRKIGW